MKAIVCSNCGAANSYEENQSSIKCDFCSNLISIPQQENSFNNNVGKSSRLKTKPEITKPIISKNSKPPYISEPHNAVRVDNGWIIHFNNKPSKFIQDESTFDYSKGGGELIVTRKDIELFEELFDWYSDNELKIIRLLDLSKNKLKNSYDISHLPNLEKLILSDNELATANFKIKSKNINHINLSNNNISELNGHALVELDGDKKVDNFELNLSNNKISAFTKAHSLFFFDILNKSEKYAIINLANNPGNFNEQLIFLENNLNPLSTEFLLKYNGGPLGLMKFRVGYTEAKCKSEIANKKLKSLTIIMPDGEKIFIPVISPSYEVLKKAYEIKFGVSYKPKACFIATAVLGSYDHPEVIELRSFRDNWLLEKKWGEGFVAWYYHYGSIAAKSIEKSFVLKKICYLLIVKPLVYLSRIVKK